MNWFSVFLLLWAAGVSGALALIPESAFGRTFFRVQAVLLLVLVGAATAVGRPLLGGAPAGSIRFLNEAIAWLLVADVIVIAALSFSRRRIVPVAFLLPVITGAVFATTLALGEMPGRPLGAALLTLHLLTCGALLGSVLVAMNLGHAYLQDAAVSFDHLVRLSKLFLGAAIAKAVVCAILVAPRAGELWAKMGVDFDWMLVLVRVGVLAFYLALAWMALSCARSKSNQSATGILYAAVVMVLIGEGISMHLTLGRGIAA